MEALWQAGATVRAYDPVAMEECRRIYGDRDDLVLCSSAMEAVLGADALAVVTEWTEFRSPDFDQIRHLLHEPVIFDGRNIYDPAYLGRLGIRYYSIGRPAQPPA
jgi:UDPglucose 6-dehydrogenase